jgi:hypothetical protein
MRSFPIPHGHASSKMKLSLLCLLPLVALAAAGPAWDVIAKDLMVSDLGLAFINPLVGYTAGISNSGNLILKSLDGTYGSRHFHFLFLVVGSVGRRWLSEQFISVNECVGMCARVRK